MKCRKEKGYLVGTWFEGTHLALKEVFQLSYFWCRQTHMREEMMFDMRRQDGSTIGSEALCDWNNFYREICLEHYLRNPVQLGGLGTVMEIDETGSTTVGASSPTSNGCSGSLSVGATAVC